MAKALWNSSSASASEPWARTLWPVFNVELGSLEARLLSGHLVLNVGGVGRQSLAVEIEGLIPLFLVLEGPALGEILVPLARAGLQGRHGRGQRGGQHNGG